MMNIEEFSKVRKLDADRARKYLNFMKIISLARSAGYIHFHGGLDDY